MKFEAKKGLTISGLEAPSLRELGRLRLKVLIAVCMLLLLPVGAASLQALQGLRTWGSSRLFIVWKFRGFRVLRLGV